MICPYLLALPLTPNLKSSDLSFRVIGGEEEPNETLVAQLTNAIRNTFSWFGGGRHVLDADEEEHEAHDDGEGVD